MVIRSSGTRASIQHYKLFQTPILRWMCVRGALWHGFGGSLKKKFMETNKQHQDIPKDVALDVPAETNTEKHINFLKIEEEQSGDTDNATSERRKEWKEGLEEGERLRDESRP